VQEALAQRLFVQDTAAFREMVAEGVRLLKAWAARPGIKPNLFLTLPTSRVGHLNK